MPAAPPCTQRRPALARPSAARAHRAPARALQSGWHGCAGMRSTPERPRAARATCPRRRAAGGLTGRGAGNRQAGGARNAGRERGKQAPRCRSSGGGACAGAVWGACAAAGSTAGARLGQDDVGLPRQLAREQALGVVLDQRQRPARGVGACVCAATVRPCARPRGRAPEHCTRGGASALSTAHAAAERCRQRPPAGLCRAGRPRGPGARREQRWAAPWRCGACPPGAGTGARRAS